MCLTELDIYIQFTYIPGRKKYLPNGSNLPKLCLIPEIVNGERQNKK